MSEDSASLVAHCGLFCGACGQYLKKLCVGCLSGGGRASCQARLCCVENEYRTCAECEEYLDCEKFSNYHNRKENLTAIRTMGLEKWAAEAASSAN